MARPLRLEFAGALYHVTARGDRREDIFFRDEDRGDFLGVLGDVCGRFNWVIHAYCQMTNHYHLLVETVDGNLWRGMRQLNGVYTQRFNRRHGLVGHLFQGRYKAILEGVQEERVRQQPNGVRRPPRSRRAGSFAGVRALARVEAKHKASDTASSHLWEPCRSASRREVRRRGERRTNAGSRRQ